MNAVTLASRAVLAHYATKVIRPVEYIVLGVFLILVAVTVLLATYVSAWWWLLMIIVIAYGLVGSIVWLIIHFTIDRLRPDQTATQKKAVRTFVTQAEQVADTLQLTRFGLILRVVRDVMARDNANILTEFAGNSKQLKISFEKVIAAFR